MRSMGKDWARGRAKETDPRIARAAAGHRGVIYRPRERSEGDAPDGRCKYPRVRFPRQNEEWTPRFAYAVGLLATDGGLTGQKTVTLVSKDKAQITTFLSCIEATNPIRRNDGAYRVQITDVRFYRWLESIGVTARKSLTLGPLAVPRPLMLDLVRGLLDGDGSIYTGTIVPNRRRYPEHVYQRLVVRFHSASATHIQWLRAELEELLGISGWVSVQRRKLETKDSVLFSLRYSKHDSEVLLPALYSDPRAPRLRRKWRKWVAFRDHGVPTRAWTRRTVAAGTLRSEQATPTIDLRRSSRIGSRRAPQERLGESPMRVRIPPPVPMATRRSSSA